MNCAEADQLIQQRELSTEEIRLLREHAQRCPRCAPEVEAAILTQSLRCAQPAAPEWFADRVMAKVATAPPPRRLSAEQLIAIIIFAVSAVFLGILLPAVVVNALDIRLPWGDIVDAVSDALQSASNIWAVLTAPDWKSYPASVMTAFIMGIALTLLLYFTKPKETDEPVYIEEPTGGKES